MDSKKIIKKYIMPNFFVRAGAILLALVCAATLVMGLLALNAETPDPVEFFPSETPTGTMAYIDVVGVSNWLYQYDSAVYYSVEDAEGYLYTVRLNDRQLKEMAAQEEYWNRETEIAPMPEAYRLVGYVQKTGNDVRESLAQSWDITEAEYEQHFGVNFLNATTSAGAENSVIWFIGALFSGLFSLLFFVLLLFASLTSSVSILEIFTPNVVELTKGKVDRKKASIIGSVICMVLGIPVSFSFGMWGDVRILGQDIFSLYDNFICIFAYPLIALCTAIMVGWIWGKTNAVNAITNGGKLKDTVAKVWFFDVKFICPIVLAVITYQGLAGFFGF
jgi:hypothetical protein